MKLLRFLALLWFSAFIATAGAQPYPAKPIRLVIGSGPGASHDALARIVSERFTRVLGQPVVVEHKPGAAGNIAAEHVARSAPDGYTLLLTLDWHVSNAGVIAKMPFDPVADFEPINVIAKMPYLLAAGPTVPARTFSELLAHARSRPNGLTIGLPGPGSPPHLMIEQIKARTGIKVVPVQYKSTAPALTDVLAGHVDLVIGSSTVVAPSASAGKLALIGATSPSRLPSFPNVPTLAESGVAGFQGGTWYALLAPARTPPAIVARLNQELAAMVVDPESVTKMRAVGLVPQSTSPQASREFIGQELVRLVGELRSAGIVPQ